jgi:phage baseplate assembly protein W
MNSISFPKMFDVNNSKLVTNLSYNIKSIHESLTSLLSTSPGELLGDPEYGCAIKDELFNITSNSNVADLKDIIVTAINKYIPSISVDNNDIKIYSNNNNKYKIIIPYKLSNVNEIHYFELML